MPPYLIELAIEPKSGGDLAEFEVALNRLAAEDDHGFDIRTDRETGQTIVSGQSEQHLEGLVDRMDSKFGIAVAVGALVPLANMFGCVNTLRSMAQGRAIWTMTFDRYAPADAAGR